MQNKKEKEKELAKNAKVTERLASRLDGARTQLEAHQRNHSDTPPASF